MNAPQEPPQIPVVDVGGTHVKILATGQETPRKFVSGPSLTAEEIVLGVLKAAMGWKYSAASIGYPGPVLQGKPVFEPHNLGPGWVGFERRCVLAPTLRMSISTCLVNMGRLLLVLVLPGNDRP
jgi:hypothetical protein